MYVQLQYSPTLFIELKLNKLHKKKKKNVLIYNIIGIVGPNNVSAQKLEFESILSHGNIRCSKGKRP